MARLNNQMGLCNITLDLLKQSNILTVTDYLVEGAEKVSSVCNASFKEILEIRQNMISNYSALPLNGTFAYHTMLSSSALIPSGIKSLDTLLQGGFMTGSVLELCGSSGEGKTQLCLSIAAHVATKLKQPIYYVDTKGDFSAHRLQSMIQYMNTTEKECSCSMERIHVTRVNDIYELISFLHYLRKSLSEDDSSPPRVIIIDSVPSLYFPFMGSDDISQGFGLLNQVMSSMKVMATEFHILFIEVNLTSSFSETENGDISIDEDSRDNVSEARPMLGKYWLHAPDTRLLICRLNNEAPQRLIRVLKSTYLPVGANCVVCVNKEGVV